MVVSIVATVGAYSANRPADVTAVQRLLNQVPSPAGGPVPLLAVDGLIGPKTNGAIAQFQMKQFGWADVRVDPGGQTIARLNGVTGQPGAMLASPLPVHVPRPVRVKSPPSSAPPPSGDSGPGKKPDLKPPSKNPSVPDRLVSRAILAQVSGPVLVSGVVRGTVRGFLGMPLYATETVRTGPFELYEYPTLSSLLGTKGRALIRYVDGSSVPWRLDPP
jgi:hypothetical protein